jgi:hypothetical protein
MTIIAIVVAILLVVWLDNPKDNRKYDDTHYVN